MPILVWISSPRLTRAASSAVGPLGVNSPGFPCGVSGFSMIRIGRRFLSIGDTALHENGLVEYRRRA